MDIANALKHRMDFLVQRQNVVAGNIANANTPDYASRDISFVKMTEQALGNMGMQTTDAHHLGGMGLAGSRAGTLKRETYPMRLDGNAVVIEEEMLKMGSIRSEHGLMTSVYGKYAQMYRTALGQNR